MRRAFDGAEHSGSIEQVMAGRHATRTLGFDVLVCPRCGGRLRLIALIEEVAEIKRILRHVGVTTEIPAPRPACASQTRVGAPDHAGSDDDLGVRPCS
jgi:hypothetical protein